MPEIDRPARHRERIAAQEAEALHHFGRRRATAEEARDRGRLEDEGRRVRRFCPSCFANDENPLHGQSLDGETCKECGESMFWSIDIPAPDAWVRRLVKEDERIEREIQGDYSEPTPAQSEVGHLVDNYGALGVVLTVLEIVGPSGVEVLDAARLALLKGESGEPEPESVEPDTTQRWTLYEHPDPFNREMYAWAITGPDGMMIYGSCWGDQTAQLVDVVSVLNGVPLPPRAENPPPPMLTIHATTDSSGWDRAAVVTLVLWLTVAVAALVWALA